MPPIATSPARDATATSTKTNGKAVGSASTAVPRFLPPGVTLDRFQDFAGQLVAALGQENVGVIAAETPLDDGDYINIDCLTHDMHSLYEKEDFVGCALVHPRGVGEVQTVVSLCAEFSVPLWTFSKGHNIGYGGAAPRVSGSLVMNLGTHMNRIIEVNPSDGYAIVEPGVTYMELQQYLVDNDMRDKVWLDCPELGYGSIVGNALDHGVGFTPYGDHWMMHCGMEVVVQLPAADGSGVKPEVVRTGMGAMQSPEGRKQAAEGVPAYDQKHNECWPLFPYGFGPVNDGIFSQGNVGIVTKMGIWLMPAPPGYEPFMITYKNESDLEQVVEIIRPLRLNMVLQNAASLRHIALDAAHYHPRTHYTNKSTDEPLDEQELSRAADIVDMGYWVYMGAVYGPKPVREALMATIKKEMLSVPGSRYFSLDDRKEEFSSLHYRAEVMRGEGAWSELRWLTHWIPNCTFLSFSPISRVSGASAKAQYELAKKRFNEAKLDYFGILSIGMREMHNIICVVYNREDPDMRRRAQWLVRTMIKDCADNGWGEFRTHIALMDQVAKTYDFNDSALMRLNESIKKALDPKGILAPGKSGIWPEHYDKSKFVLGDDYIK